MISCHQHDYIEIACLYRLRLRVILVDGERIEGRARDTGSRAGREWLQLETGQGLHELDLERIRRLEALDGNPHFRALDLRHGDTM